MLQVQNTHRDCEYLDCFEYELKYKYERALVSSFVQSADELIPSQYDDRCLSFLLLSRTGGTASRMPTTTALGTLLCTIGCTPTSTEISR